MKWIEIITLRSLVKESRQLVDELLHQVAQQREPEPAATIRVYHHPTIETDLSIHIQWETETQKPGNSPLGEQLSYALKGLGLLNHSIWVEASAMQ